MDDSRRDDDGDGVGFPDEEGLVPCGVTWTVFPQSEFVFSINKAEEVGLINVLVGAASDARVGDADVAHCWEGSFRDFVRSEEFGEVATRIVVASEGLNDHAGWQVLRH